MVPPCQRFTHQRILTLKFLSGYVHRVHSLSLAFARQLPQRGSREWLVPFIGVLANVRGWRAIFIAPTKLRGFDIVPFNEGHSLSLAFARQLPQRGSREWLVPFIGVLANVRGFGRFSSPLRNSEDITLYHSMKDTPSVSLRSTAPSEREPGMGGCHSSGCSLISGVTGDFHRPYETQRI